MVTTVKQWQVVLDHRVQTRYLDLQVKAARGPGADLQGAPEEGYALADAPRAGGASVRCPYWISLGSRRQIWRRTRRASPTAWRASVTVMGS